MLTWGKKTEDTSYKTAKENLELKSALEDANRLAARLQEQINEIANINRKLPFEFDFKAMRAFSVERNFHNGEWCTIIGYLRDESERSTDPNGYHSVLTNTTVKEWYYYCDDENHKRLAAEFKNVISK